MDKGKRWKWSGILTCAEHGVVDSCPECLKDDRITELELALKHEQDTKSMLYSQVDRLRAQWNDPVACHDRYYELVKLEGKDG